MNLQEIINELDLTVLTDAAVISEKNPQSGYASDMLSCVMSGAKQNSLWITLQSHLNIVAVATLLELAAIIITEGNIPDQPTINKANQENVVLLSTTASTYQIVGKLWELGIKA